MHTKSAATHQKRKTVTVHTACELTRSSFHGVGISRSGPASFWTILENSDAMGSPFHPTRHPSLEAILISPC